MATNDIHNDKDIVITFKLIHLLEFCVIFRLLSFVNFQELSGCSQSFYILKCRLRPYVSQHFKFNLIAAGSLLSGVLMGSNFLEVKTFWW